MKKATFYKIPLFLVFIFTGLQSLAQDSVEFTPVFDDDLKGDILLIGNNILGRNNNAYNNDNQYNSNIDMRYIDIDGDATTFSSTSADLVVPNPNCYEIRYAALYWGAVERDSNQDFTNVKFRGPSGGYVDVAGNIIYDRTPIGSEIANSLPYACYADVTSIVQGLATNTGTYTVANVSSRQGSNGGTGQSAGWSLYVVYEDPTLPSKSITSFNGFEVVSVATGGTVDVDVDGFRTIPTGPVRANLAFATLEGDSPIPGDFLALNGSSLSTADRPANNFFNSSVTQLNALPVNNRNPNSSNTLGFDTGIIAVPNPGNSVINNGDTSAVVTLGTVQDTYFQYFFSFAVEIIEPDIVFTKTVEDELGQDISDQVVGLGQELNYVISFQNIGNDDGQNLIIRDVLPINTVFDFPSGLDLPPGVTVVSYDPATREIVLSVEDYLIEEGDPVVEFRINANVVENCNDLSSACSNLVQNQAFASYVGTVNPDFIITDDPSVSSNTGCLLVPQATNFLADIDECEFRENAILCGDSIDIVAADGYDSYSWSSDPSGSPVLGTSQTLTVTESGTYYVYNSAPAPCRSIIQIFDVIIYGENQTNPILPQADEVVTCPDDGRLLPNIFLCGLNDSRDLSAAITDSNSIIWEQLDESSCAAVGNNDCANEDGACSWNQVATGTDYTVNTAGQFRLTVNYDGGCFNQFFFNVYQNVLNPTAVATDILCDSIGTITVNNVPSDYEFSLDGTNYQTSNIFNVATAGTYTVYVRQQNVPDTACVFTVENVRVRLRDFTFAATATNPLCNGQLGSIQVSANDGEPQYTFTLFDDTGALVTTVGPIVESSYNFENLNAGEYTANVQTEDGCVESNTVTIVEPDLLSLTADLAAPFIDCLIQATDGDGNLLFDEFGNPIFEETQGEINMNAVGGTPPYVFYINSTTVFQGSSVYNITSAGTYNIRVVDANSCEATYSIEVEEILPPEYTVTATDIQCADSGDSGTITFNVTTTYGSSLEYSIDNGVTFSSNNVFTNLPAGDYETLIQYTFGPSSCTTLPETVTITIPEPLVGQADLTVDYTCDTTAQITVSNVSGGTPGYEYSIDGVTFQTGTVFTNLTNGSYVVVIQDSRGCSLALPVIVIDALDPPTDLEFSNTALTCPSNLTDITITSTTGGIAPLEYRIIAPAAAVTAYQNSNVFANLSPDTYTFEVRDANGCLYSEQYAVDGLPSIAVSAQTQNDVTCFGDSDGSILVTVSGTSNFEYTVNGGAAIAGTSPFTLSGLGAGSYAIVIIDTVTNCEGTDTATVQEPGAALTLSAAETVITCEDDGSVELTATGGWGGYTYTITQPDNSVLGPQSSTTFTGLSLPGTYTALVADVNGCEVTTTFDLTTPEDVEATLSGTSNLCYDTTSGATLVVDVTAGVAPFEFSINGGPFQASNSFPNLIPGSYTITVRDAYGCTLTLASQSIAPQLSLTTILDKELDCTSSPDGQITGTITGGYPPYTYAVSINGAAYTSLGTTGSPFTYTVTTDGTYQFQVTDDQGCIAESGVTTVAPITNPTVVATPTDPLCFNDSNGQVLLTGSGGSGAYMYSDDNVTYTSDPLFTGLVAGTYTFYVRDGNECIGTISVTLNNPDELVASASIPANTSCSATTVITVTATGGTGSYEYSFEGSSYSSSNTYTVNNTGVIQNITYAVRDTNGCIDTDSIDIPPYDPITGVAFADSNAITCNDTTTDVTVTPTGGISPFTFVITAPGAATTNTTGVNSGVFTGLTPGNYTFEVTDANGCSATASHSISPVRPIQVAFAKADEQCFNAGDGEAVFTITDVSSTGNYTYTISPTVTTDTQVDNVVTVTGLTAGTYTIDVVDTATGCTDSASVTIDAATQITFTATASSVNCNESISTITFTGPSGGTPGYTYAYVIQGDPAPAPSAFSNTTTVDTSVLGSNITVWVKDANDCTVSQDINIVTDPTPTVTLAVDDQCGTIGNSYTITATASSGVSPYAYSIDGTNFQTSATFTVTPGTYTVTVRDANGCTATSNSVTVSPQLVLNSEITEEFDCAPPLPSEAQITLTFNGGSGPYTYEVEFNGGGFNPQGALTSPFIYSTPNPGDYQFRITDSNGCSVTSVVHTIDPLVPVTATETHIDPTCNGDTNGSITLTATSGEAPFTYSIDGGTTFVSSNVFGGLSAGTYNYVVRDSKQCEDTGSITLNDPAPIDVTIVRNAIQCNSNVPGSLDVTINSGGVAPFIYTLFDNTNTQIDTSGSTALTTHTFSGLSFGDYFVTIVDANGCDFRSAAQRIETPPNISLTSNTTTGSCATGATVTIEVLTGAQPFIYSIFGQPATAFGPTANTSHTFTGLDHNTTYFFQVEDAGSCFSIIEVTTPPLSPIDISALSTTDVSCNGDSTGEVSFTVSDYDASVTMLYYEVRDQLTNQPIAPPANGTFTGLTGAPASDVITGLGAGNYTLFVEETDGTLCSTTQVFQITEPIQALTATVVDNINANCNTGAQVTVNATGGTGPYEYAYALSPSAVPTSAYTTNNVLNLDASLGTTWDIYVRDANGCPFTLPVTVATDAAPTIDPVATQCYVGTPFTVTVSGTTFNGNATYSAGGPYQNSPNFTITAPGSYDFFIRDDNGCTATTTYVVNDQLTLIPTITKELDCTASPDAEITLTAGGGDASYTYEVSTDGGITYTAMGSNVYSAATPIEYFFRVTDGAGCQAINSIEVSPIVPVTFTPVPTDVSCNAGSDGSITVNVTGGVGPFTYEIEGVLNTPADSNIFTGLSQGTYDIVVIDGSSCRSAIQSVTIDEPTPVTATASLSANTTCDVETTITVTASGGTPTGIATGYYYSFEGNGFSTDNTYVVNDNGTVQTINYIVRDLNNCEFTGSIDVQPLDPPTDLDFSATVATCDTPSSDVTITATDGIGPLTYDIIIPAGDPNTTGDTTGIYTGLSVGSYTFEVIDANGCTYQEQFTVPAIENIEVLGQLVSDITCNPGNNGEVSFTVSNFTGTYSYSINGGATVTGQTNATVLVSNISIPGTQTIDITDEVTGCVATASVTVAQVAPLTLIEDTNINANCNDDAQVTVSATGGTPPYVYSFVVSGAGPGTFTSSNTAALDPPTSTSWDVYVQDNNNCQDMITVTIDTDPLPSGFTFAATSQCPDASGEYELVVTPGSGIAPLEYSIGNGYQTGTTFTVNAPGMYTVTIRDGNECTVTESVTILPALEAIAAISNLPSCSDDDGEIEVTAAGGSGDYEYTINPDPLGVSPSTNPIFVGLPAGVYDVTAIDRITSCTFTTQVTLEAPTPVTFTTSHEDVSCNAGSDGTITVTLGAGNDNPLYTYAIIAPAGFTRPAQSSNIFTGLSANTYTVQVTSGRGCTLTEDVIIEEPDALTASATATSFNCAADNSVNTSTITITGADGTPPYLYSIDGTSYFTSNTFEVADTGAIQTITVYVRDDNNCDATNTVTIDPLETITAAAFVITSPIDCNNTGEVSINVTGGSGNFEYQLLPNGIPQPSNIFALTDPGTYYFQINDLTTGCYFLTDFEIAPFDVIEAQLSTLEDVDCFGNASGEIALTVLNYTGDYTYDVLDSSGAPVGISGTGNTNSNPQIITGLNGGNYTVNVSATDTPFCATVSNSVAIESPITPVAVIATETYNVTCTNDQGIITAAGSGGTPPYEYQLTGPVTVAFSPNATFSDLSAGLYTVTVRDANDCLETDTVLLEVPDAITATFTPSATEVACFGDQTVSITVTNVQGGQGADYNYTLNRISPNASTFGPQSSNVFSNLGAGVYSVTIQDTYSCELTSANITITEPDQIDASLVVNSTQTCLTDATLTLSATGGTGLYTYDDADDFTTPLGTFVTDVTFSVVPGTYQYFIRDENGCVSRASNEITIEPLVDLEVNLTSDNPTINCVGDSSGSITATAIGGLGNYVYTLQDEFGVTVPATQSSPGVFTGLTAGTYQVYVQSGDCQDTSSTLIITEPLEAVTADYDLTPITCNGANDGVLTINASGGTGDIIYAISPNLDQFFTTNVFEDLQPGDYTVIFQDQLGCFDTFDFRLEDPEIVALGIVPNSIIPETCFGDADGSFSVEISGGSLPYEVVLDDPNGTYTVGGPTQTTFVFDNLSGGDHIVYVRDAQGCESPWNITFPETVNIIPTLDVDPNCDTNTPGNTVTVTVDGFIPDPSLLTYSLDDSGNEQSDNVFINVSPGTHYITVIYDGVCSEDTIPFIIEDIQPLSLTLEEGNLNEIVAVATGGFGNNQYTFNGISTGTTNTYVISESGTYTVIVTDAEGCTATADIYIEFIDVCVPNYFTPNDDGVLDTWAPGCADNYPNLKTQIFDRYGRVIVKMNVGQSWNGKYNSKELPTGDYWYIITLGPEGNDREFVGHFTLYR
ncbi:T9SS type B sorting domain-containing protein [Dokdonia sp. Hel_I_53]|uniref:T9SS type B sorting domain-containing protein n=1 Tax=Dokdonia sp. Hel_I_53 TaxID=1566287 RepID=UPI00119B579F|nr:T9SS type B sorting domain-containing protein [Dokdonia sp. Hel_I_53]TVZ51926.1 gliding motility-associated-like protein [Dokdonia sp. Hel_I_53]